jgi:hypothetical protein
MAKIGRRGYKLESSVGFSSDISQIEAALDRMDDIPNHVLSEIADEITYMGQALLRDLFEDAMARQSETALPEEFREHIRYVVNHAEFNPTATGTGVEVDFDFNQLGTVQELKRAFHQGARTADGDIIDGPYEGEELENSAADRHLYWEAMAEGRDKAPTREGKSMRIQKGAWERTKQKYIEIWGDKAPQWLYLQFGQDKWKPKIQKSSIIEDFTEIYTRKANIIFNETLAAEVAYAQETGTVLTDHGRRLVEATGELGPSGKPRQVGQFYPNRR